MLILDANILLESSRSADNHFVEGETVGSACHRLKSEGHDRRAALDVIGRALSRGEISIDWPVHSKDLETLTSDTETARRLCETKPWLWNSFAYAMEWKTFPEYNDFLSGSSPVYFRKKYQWEIYEKLLKKTFSRIPAGGKILDSGGGVGRAAVPLCNHGFNVTVTDASRRALSAAWKHLSKVGKGNYDLAWADAADLGFIENESFDAAFSIEVLCYHGNPEIALSELVRSVKPGGNVAFSVENRIGALLSDQSLKEAGIKEILLHKKVQIDEYLYVKYFDRKELRDMAHEAGLIKVEIVPCHFIADGLFDAIVNEKQLSSESRRKRMHTVEDFMRGLPAATGVARALLVTGVKRN